MSDKEQLQEGVHYYLEGDRVIFTALFHFQRGQCCGNYCRHCPFDPKHKHNAKILAERFGYLRESS
jgi:Family of unknown function (DUF5522)